MCEPKYAATLGVFYTGAPDDGNPSRWSPTAHVMVAGGIIPTSEGQYTATDTVDIFREEGIDPATGKVSTPAVERGRVAEVGGGGGGGAEGLSTSIVLNLPLNCRLNSTE